MPLENADYYIYLAPLPAGVHALVSDNGDSTYSLYLNEQEDFDHWLDGYCHELWHIIHEDFDNGKSISEVEGL